MSRDAEGVGRCKGCGDRRPLTEAGYCNDDCAPCGCMESVALRAEVARLKGLLDEIEVMTRLPALSPKVPK